MLFLNDSQGRNEFLTRNDNGLSNFLKFTHNDSLFCHFGFSLVSENPQTFVILNEWNEQKIHIVILSVSEISTEFKTHFDFMDTSLSYESSVWQGKKLGIVR